MSTRPTNIPAIERATSMEWETIVAALEKAGGADLDHPGLAAAANALFLGAVENSEWWAQGAAVAYEQQIGRRVPGQSSDGSFRLSASKTVPGGIDDALAAVEALFGGRTELGGVPIDGEPAVSRSEKWRYWRAGLADGSKVSVVIGSKPPTASGETRSGVSVEVTGLSSADDIPVLKDWYKAELAAL